MKDRCGVTERQRRQRVSTDPLCPLLPRPPSCPVSVCWRGRRNHHRTKKDCSGKTRQSELMQPDVLTSAVRYRLRSHESLPRPDRRSHRESNGALPAVRRLNHRRIGVANGRNMVQYLITHGKTGGPAIRRQRGIFGVGGFADGGPRSPGVGVSVLGPNSLPRVALLVLASQKGGGKEGES